MKKLFAALLAVCMALTPIQLTALAETAAADEAGSAEVILSAADAEWTLPDGLAVYGISGNDYGDTTLTIKGVGILKTDGTVDTATALTLEQLGTDTYVTYSKNIPGGVYRVMYYYPSFIVNTDYTAARNVTILDTDIEITDSNGTHTVTSTKPDITFGGWAEVGVYEFVGDGSDKIKAYANQENKYVGGQWKKTLMTSQIKLIPVNEDNSALLAAVNAAQTAAELAAAVEQEANGFVDKNALTYMSNAYAAMLAERPQGGFKSAYAFKNVFEACVDAQLTKVTVPSEFFAWQNNEQNVSLSGYRINWTPVELSVGESRAIVGFKLADRLNIKDMRLRLKPYAAAVRLQTNAVVTKYSNEVTELPNGNKERNKFLNNVTFTDLPEADRVKLAAAPRSVGCESIIAAAEETGFISLWLTGEDIVYPGINEQNNYELAAELEVVYDNTYNPDMSAAWSSVNNDAPGCAKVLDLSGFDKIALVSVNNAVLNPGQYSFNGSRLMIDGSCFKEDGSYIIKVGDGSETRSLSAELVSEKILYAADSTKAVWSAASTVQNNMTAADEKYKTYGVASATDTTLTYTGLPVGAYEVYIYYPKWENISVPAARTSGIMDSSVQITDKNGTYSIKSTKPSINYEGYTSIGEYEFSGAEGEQLRLSVNTDYTDITAFSGTRYFAHCAVKLVPLSNDGLVKYYYDNGKTVIDTVNACKNASELAAAVKAAAEYDETLADTDILCDMSGVWQRLYARLSQKKFTTEYELGAAFAAAVSEDTEIIEIPSSIMLSTYTDDGETLRVLYKKNGTAGLLTPEKAYASFTFNGTAELEAEAILGAELKLTATAYADDIALKGYSLYRPVYVTAASVADGNLNGYSDENVECNVFFDSFTDLDAGIISPFGAVIGTAEIKAAAEQGLPLSYCVASAEKITDYTNTDALTGAVLKVKLDKTYAKDILTAAKQICAADTLEAARVLMKKYAAIFEKSEEECDEAALALWCESIGTEQDVTDLLTADGAFEMRKNAVVLTDSEYIGGVIVKNFGTAAQPVRVIAAAYSGSRLIGVDFSDIVEELPGGDALVYAFAIDCPTTEEISEVKVFAWGDTVRLVPLAEAVKHK